VTERVTRTEAFLLVAQQLSRLSSCHSRHVGCVLTDEHHRLIGLGYNGCPTKIEHACDSGCVREDCKPGERLDLCLAIHAEANALMHCEDIKRVHACYVWGATPCWECAKLLCNSSVKAVFSSSQYGSEADARIISLFHQRCTSLNIVTFPATVYERSDEHSYSITLKKLC